MTADLVAEGLPFDDAYREARRLHPIDAGSGGCLGRLARRIDRIAVEIALRDS